MIAFAMAPVPLVWIVRKFKIIKMEPDIPIVSKDISYKNFLNTSSHINVQFQQSLKFSRTDLNIWIFSVTKAQKYDGKCSTYYEVGYNLKQILAFKHYESEYCTPTALSYSFFYCDNNCTKYSPTFYCIFDTVITFFFL